jgi:biotin carboxyl carrier protein/amino acid transporter
MLVDYVLTVAVSVAAAVDTLVSAFPGLHGARVGVAIGVIAGLLVINLRGVRPRGPGFAAPTYLFIAGIVVMTLWGLGAALFGETPVAESAEYDVRPELTDLTVVAIVVLFARAFASGGAALTGVRAITNGVPSFNTPKRKNAATTLVLMGAVTTALFIGITTLAVMTDVRYARNACDLVGFDCLEDPQRTVIAQVAAAVFGDGTVPFFYILLATALVLLVAANTAFHGFPMLASTLAQQRYLPRQLHSRGDHRAFAGGMLLLSGAACALVAAFGSSVTRLLPLYLVAVFASYTLGQAGMVRHWTRVAAGPLREEERGRAIGLRVLSAASALLAATVMLVMAVTEFLAGVWVVFAVVPVLYVLMRGIQRYYLKVNAELAVPADKSAGLLPSRVHAIVLVSRLHRPTLRALAYARVGRPDVLEAITVNVDVEETRALTDEWDRRNLPVPLKVLDSPYREITRPVLKYVRSVRRESPRDLIVVYIPEYVVGRWWEHLLHNQSALRLKGRLLFEPGIMVTSVPYQLVSSQLDIDRLDYLNRDCFFSGVQEGRIGVDRIILMLQVHEDQLVVEEKGIYSIENFLNARRLMYWQVYLHKTTVSAERMLVNLVRRAQALIRAGENIPASEALKVFLENSYNIESLTVAEVENPEKDIAFPDSVVSMLRGDLGQSPGGWPEGLQKKALKGETPITVRPGSLLADADLDAGRAELAEKLGRKPDEYEFAAWLMYPKVFSDFAAVSEEYGPVSVLPTPVYFYGMAPEDEIFVDIERGKTLVIRCLAIGETDEKGMVTVFFELNGQPRRVKVPDRVHGASAAKARPKAEAGNEAHLGAPMPGVVSSVSVSAGQKVKAGDVILSIEAMKMETALHAERDGEIAELLVRAGDQIGAKDLLVVFG